MLVTITFKIDFETLMEIERYAESHGLTRSAVIRLALRRFLEGQGLAQEDEPNVKRVKIELPGEPSESENVRRIKVGI